MKSTKASEYGHIVPLNRECDDPDPGAFVLAGKQSLANHMNPEYAKNSLEEALNHFSKALEASAETPEVLSQMSVATLRLGDYKKADKLARRSLALDPKQKDPYFVLGYIQYKSRHYQAASEYLKKAVRVGGLDNARAQMCLSHTYREMASEEKDLFKQVRLRGMQVWHFVLATLTYPLSSDRLSWTQLYLLLVGLSWAYILEELDETGKALTSYLHLYERFPGLSCLTNNIADIYRKKNQKDEALYWYQKTLIRHPANEAAGFETAQILEERNQFEEVIERYQQLLKLRPNDPNIHCYLGNIYYNNHSFTEALAHYKSAMALAGDKHWCSLIAQSIASIYTDVLENLEAAQIAYQMAIDYNPHDIESYIQLGLLYYRTEDFHNAELVYLEALQIESENPRLYSNLGYLSWRKGDVEQAIRYYQKSMDYDPFYEIPYNNLGVIYLDTLGNITGAIELFEKAISLNENYALAYYNMGRAYSFMDKRLEAANCFKVAQQLNMFTKELDNDELDARINHLFNPN